MSLHFLSIERKVTMVIRGFVCPPIRWCAKLRGVLYQGVSDMKILFRQFARLMFAMTLLIGLAVVGSTGAMAQQAAEGAYAKQIQGAWILVSIYNEQDGKRVEPFGANPRGSMILTPGGRFSIELMKASLPKFASNNRVKGTAEEYQAVVEGSVAFFGTYSILNEKDQTVGLKIEAATFPNWGGQDQKRVMTVAGDELKVINPTAAIGGTNYQIYRRAK
jgi:hypothetical protein